MLSVYVAGSSQELDRVRRAYAAVNSTPGLTLAHDWVASFLAEGADDAQLPREAARRYALEDLRHVHRAHVIWFLAPETSTRGAWVEFGYALARAEGGHSRVIVSGPHRQSIFCACAASYGTDQEALTALREYARGSHEAQSEDFGQ